MNRVTYCQRVAATRRRRLLTVAAAQRQGGKCIYCGGTFSETNRATCEHIVPKSKGGPDHEDNVAASCARCNNERGRKNHTQFLRFKAKLRDAQAHMESGDLDPAQFIGGGDDAN